jgi:hypothetical protein
MMTCAEKAPHQLGWERKWKFAEIYPYKESSIFLFLVLKLNYQWLKREKLIPSNITCNWGGPIIHSPQLHSQMYVVQTETCFHSEN